MATEYGSRLRKARKAADLTQAELTAKTGIPQSTISTAEREGHGSSDTPVYAKALGVDAHWLATGEGPMFGPPGDERTTVGTERSNAVTGPSIKGLVPLISSVQAGEWAEIVDRFQPGDAEDWLPCPVKHGSNTFCLRVDGQSMSNPGAKPSYDQGDVIFVDPGRAAQPGDRVVVRLEGQRQATFKQYLEEDGRKFLKALNPDWKPRYIEINGEATICGVVIGKWVPE